MPLRLSAMIRLVCLALPISTTAAWDSSRMGRSLLAHVRNLKQHKKGEEAACAIFKKGLECEGKAKETCAAVNDKCEWKTEPNRSDKCEISEKASMEATISMMGKNSPMGALMSKGAACNAVTQESSCKENGDCEWKKEGGDERCDVNGMVSVQLLLGNKSSAILALVQKAAACGTLSSDDCGINSECEWKQEDEKCDVGGEVAMKLMLGDDNPIVHMMQKAGACSGTSDGGTCAANDDCEWTEDSTCDLKGAVVMEMSTKNPELQEFIAKTTVCENKTGSNCGGNEETKDCELKEEGGEAKCALGDSAMNNLMLGGGDDSMMGIIQKTMECGGKASQQDCGSLGSCRWEPAAQNGKGECEVDAMSLMQGMMGGPKGGMMEKMMKMATDCEGKKEKQACEAAKKCRWNGESGECDMNPKEGIDELCGDHDHGHEHSSTTAPGNQQVDGAARGGLAFGGLLAAPALALRLL